MENETDREKERKESQHLILTSKNIQVFNFFLEVPKDKWREKKKAKWMMMMIIVNPLVCRWSYKSFKRVCSGLRRPSGRRYFVANVLNKNNNDVSVEVTIDRWIPWNRGTGGAFKISPLGNVRWTCLFPEGGWKGVEGPLGLVVQEKFEMIAHLCFSSPLQG